MARIRLDQDLRPVTEFRAHAAELIDRVRTTKRPVVLTQHGRGSVVLVDVREYERMMDALESIPRGTTSVPTAAHDPVEAYKSGVDRTLLRENLSRPVGERIRRLAELASFAGALRGAARRKVLPDPEGPAAPTGPDSS